MHKFTIELLVANRYGVLNRITGLYTRRCFNIDSIHSYETAHPGQTRVLISSTGDEYIQTQMVRQLAKLYDVIEVRVHAAEAKPAMAQAEYRRR